MRSLQEIEQRFIAWGQKEENLRAAVVVGSQARLDHPADAWSDLDILLFARSASLYQDSTAWVEALAPVWVSIPSRTVAGEAERLVLFAGGLQVDFVFNDASVLAGLAQMAASGQLPEAVLRGVRVLFDKDQVIPPLPDPGKPSAQPPPNPETFTRAWESFWFSAVHAAKQLRRGDLAFYKGAEQGMRHLLLPFLEWCTRAERGWDTDTWHNGRFIREWLDAASYKELAETYTPLESEACWRGLLRLVALFQRSARETAAAVGLVYPAEKDASLAQFVQHLYETRET